jgi:hypothetical protein
MDVLAVARTARPGCHSEEPKPTKHLALQAATSEIPHGAGRRGGARNDKGRLSDWVTGAYLAVRTKPPVQATGHPIAESPRTAVRAAAASVFLAVGSLTMNGEWQRRNREIQGPVWLVRRLFRKDCRRTPAFAGLTLPGVRDRDLRINHSRGGGNPEAQVWFVNGFFNGKSDREPSISMTFSHKGDMSC